MALRDGLGSDPNSVALADFNADGRLDIATTDLDSEDSGVQLPLLINGGGPFTEDDVPTSGATFGLAVADLNGDGKPDLVSTSLDSDTVELAFADPSGLAFPQSTTFALPGRPSAVAVGELDGAGLEDVVVADSTNEQLLIYAPTSAGVYPAALAPTILPLPAGEVPSSIAIGDLNGDHKPDIAVTDAQGNTLTLFLTSAASPGYSTQVLQTGPGTGPRSAAIGDLNGDGLPDLVVADGGGTGDEVTLFTQETGGTFSATTLPAGAFPWSVAIADLNGDGLPDIAVADKGAGGAAGGVTTLLKDTSGNGYTASTLPADGGPVALAVGDVNGDGKPDLVTADHDSGTLTVMTQVPPAAPELTADTPPSGAVGVPYSYRFGSSGRPPARFSVTSGALPAGLVLDPASGLLSGTPSASGSFAFTVKASNGVAPDATVPVTVVVSGVATAPAFTADTPPATATDGQLYAYTFKAAGNPAPTYVVNSGSFPPGLDFDRSQQGASSITGNYGGNPGAVGKFTFTVEASNGVGADAVSPPITINVVAPGAPVFNDDTPPGSAALGAPYAYRFEASGGPPPAYSVTSGSLPSGLTLAAGGTLAGTLSGVPTASGTFTFTVGAANGVSPDAVSGPITITIPSGPAAPQFAAQAPPSVPPVGSSYSYKFVASGSPAPTFSVGSGSLPAGLSLNSATGVLSGTLPGTPESSSFTVKASNGVNSDAVTPQLTITSPGFTAAQPPSTATLGTPFTYRFAAAGHPSYDFADGAPPDGLALEGSTGVLSGTPTASGIFTFSVDAYLPGGELTTSPITINVPPGPAAAPTFTADAPPDQATGGSPYSYQLAATGNPAPNFAIASGALPPGLRLARFTGLLSGTPTTAGTFAFKLSAGNQVGADATTPTITITVGSGTLAAPVFTADAPPSTGGVGTAYQPYTFAATGDPAPSFTLSAGALPDGLSLDRASGVLSGTPTGAGTFTFTVSATNGVAPDASSGQVTITVKAAPMAPVFTAATPPTTATLGSAYPSYTFAASGQPPPTFGVTSGTLPGGLSLDGGGGVLSGTPTTAGTFTFTVGATNGVGQNATSGPITITVAAGPAAPAAPAEAPPAPAESPPPLGGSSPTTKPSSAKPSNIVNLAKLRAAGNGVITLDVTVPGAGRVLVRSTSKIQPKKAQHAKKAPKPRTISYAANHTSARSRPGTVAVTIAPGKSGAAALRLYKKLRVIVSVTFTPTGGVAHTRAEALTVTTR